MHNLDVRVLDPRLLTQLPEYATPGSAGLDLRACIDAPLVIQPGETVLVPAGIAIHLDDSRYAAMVLPRSGLGSDDRGRDRVEQERAASDVQVHGLQTR